MDFHSARLFFAYYGFLLRFLGNLLGSAGVGDEHWSILIYCTFCVFAHFAFLALFWHFFGFSGHSGILGVLVSYEVTRGILLVEGTVNNGLGGSSAFLQDFIAKNRFLKFPIV